MFQLDKIDKSWTLFLDRDGVINQEKRNEYVLNRSQFIFYEGAVEAIKKLSDLFGLIILVTNQRGVIKQLMTLDDLHDVHDYMQQKLIGAEARIDKIYYCTDWDDTSPNRKPNPGMALQAAKDFPQIDFSKSIMAGNKLSDMKFGRNAGMHTVYIASTDPDPENAENLIDLQFDSLAAFAENILV